MNIIHKNIIDDYINFLTIGQISKKNNIKISTIYYVLNKYNIPKRGSSNANTKRFIEKHINITKDILQQLYMTEQQTIKQISTQFKIGEQTTQRLLRLHNIKSRSLQEHFAIEKNRVDHGVRMSEALSKKADVFSKKSKEMWVKWGNKQHPNLIKKMQTKEYKENMRNMMLERHKTSWHNTIKPLISTGLVRCWKQNLKFREKISSYASKIMSKIQNDAELYKQWHTNFVAALNSPEYKAKQSIIIKKLWLNKEYRIKMAQARMNQPIISTQQLTLYDILRSLNIQHIPEYALNRYNFDCYLPDYNILIEVQGDYWHNLPKAIRNDKSKATHIERYHQELALKYLWEHEFKCQDKIINLVKYWCKLEINLIQFNVNDLIMKQIDTETAKFFMGAYHYTNKVGNNVAKLGYYLGDQLIGVIIFGNIVRNETATRLGFKSREVLELSRLAIHPLYQIKNCASKMISIGINYVKKNLNHVKMLVSFADNTFNHHGTVYRASNWKFDGMVAPSYWYLSPEGYVCHKKTLWDHAKSLKLNENDFANKYGYKRVDGLEKSRFIYKL